MANGESHNLEVISKDQLSTGKPKKSKSNVKKKKWIFHLRLNIGEKSMTSEIKKRFAKLIEFRNVALKWDANKYVVNNNKYVVNGYVVQLHDSQNIPSHYSQEE